MIQDRSEEEFPQLNQPLLSELLFPNVAHLKIPKSNFILRISEWVAYFLPSSGFSSKRDTFTELPSALTFEIYLLLPPIISPSLNLLSEKIWSSINHLATRLGMWNHLVGEDLQLFQPSASELTELLYWLI